MHLGNISRKLTRLFILFYTEAPGKKLVFALCGSFNWAIIFATLLLNLTNLRKTLAGSEHSSLFVVIAGDEK
jgi:hypothetical protein